MPRIAVTVRVRTTPIIRLATVIAETTAAARPVDTGLDDRSVPTNTGLGVRVGVRWRGRLNFRALWTAPRRLRWTWENGHTSMSDPQGELGEAHSKQAPGSKRVLQVLGPSSGGIRRHVGYLASNPPQGYHTAGVAGPAGLATYFEKDNFFTTSDGGFSLDDAAADVVHAHGLTAALQALRWTRLGTRGPRVVVTVHTSLDQTLRASTKGAGSAMAQKAMWRAARLALRRASAVIVVSGLVRDQLGFGEVVPPGLDLPVAEDGAREKIRRELGTPQDATVVLAVGRLHPDKQLGSFIRAIDGSGAEGWIAGDGPERETLEKQAEGTGVRLLGHRADVGNLLAAADVFALPAHAESYGFAVMEAVAAGLPVVATRTGAIAELVGGSGLLVDPDDAGGFRDAVLKLVASPDLRRKLAAAALEQDIPSPEELVGRIGRIYERVLR